MEIKYVDTSTLVFPINGENINLVNDLPVGVYRIEVDEGIMLAKEKNVVLPEKVFGLVKERSAIILNTFNKRKNKTTGVLLSGLKGTGKTLLANQICKDSNLPIIKISSLKKINTVIDFLKTLTTPYILFIDEFEKKILLNSNSRGDFDDKIDYEHMANFLSFLDGEDFNQKLVLLTINDLNKMPQALLERPSRIFYHYNYGGLLEQEINEVIKYYMRKNYTEKNKDEKIAEIMKEVAFASDFNLMTFDMLYAILEEVCRYPSDSLDSIIQRLNVGLAESSVYCKVFLSLDGVLVDIQLNRYIDMKDFDISAYNHTFKYLEEVYDVRFNLKMDDFLYKQKDGLHFKFPLGGTINKQHAHGLSQTIKKNMPENETQFNQLEIVIRPMVSNGLRRS